MINFIAAGACIAIGLVDIIKFDGKYWYFAVVLFGLAGANIAYAIGL